VQAREVFIITLKPEPGIAGDRALRAALKTLLRRHGLRCTAIRCEPPMLEEAGQSRVANEVLAHNAPEYGE
jgi:hypothetical protein